MLQVVLSALTLFFFFNDTATTEIYTLSLHDALPISRSAPVRFRLNARMPMRFAGNSSPGTSSSTTVPKPACASRHTSTTERSEEHTSELQSRLHIVCRLLLEKTKHHAQRVARRRWFG